TRVISETMRAFAPISSLTPSATSRSTRDRGTAALAVKSPALAAASAASTSWSGSAPFVRPFARDDEGRARAAWREAFTATGSPSKKWEECAGERGPSGKRKQPGGRCGGSEEERPTVRLLSFPDSGRS